MYRPSSSRVTRVLVPRIAYAVASAFTLFTAQSTLAGPGTTSGTTPLLDPPKAVAATPSHGVSRNWRYPAVTIDETLPAVGKGVGDNIAVDASGRLYAVFTSAPASNGAATSSLTAGLYFFISDDEGLTWSAPERFPLASEAATLGTICVDDYNRLHFVWLDREPDTA